MRRDAALAKQLSRADDDAGLEDDPTAVVRREQAELLRQFVREHARWLRNLAARFVGFISADDVAQDAFESLICWTRMNPIPKVMELLRSHEDTKKLLYTITARRAYDHFRRRQRRREARDDAEIERREVRQSMERARVDEQIDRVERAYATLSPMQRIAHVLHHYCGCSHAEAAALLEISETNCRTLVCRANRALKSAMEIRQ
jgi:RNA polymerase sigma-70 factor (ECF subfamily)